jgi:predicted nucleotidyltransferase
MLPKTFETALDQHKASMPWLKDRIVFVTRHGSHAYGTNTPTSDEDFKGFALAPWSYYLGFVKQFEQAETHDPDAVIYEIKKFFSLAADCNPSIIEVLWTDPADHIITTKMSDYVMENRDLFLSRKAKHTFTGYAISQLKRIQQHYKWLHNPPKKEPERADFGLPERTLIPADQRAVVEANVKGKLAEWDGLLDWDGLDVASIIAIRSKMSQYLEEIGTGIEDKLWVAAARTIGVPENFIRLTEMERAYNNARRVWNQYKEWQLKRNPVRAALEAKSGYDTKHGMHLVRLMRMGYEILSEGKVIVRRPDAEELLSIRNGAWSYDKIVEYAKDMEQKIDAAEKVSSLPRAPDRATLDNICIECVKGF